MLLCFSPGASKKHLNSSRRHVHPQAVAGVDGSPRVGADVFGCRCGALGRKLEVVLLQEHGQGHGGLQHGKLIAHAPVHSHGDKGDDQKESVDTHKKKEGVEKGTATTRIE